MIDEKYGGAAFPTQDNITYYHGMDLRDWFAGMALTVVAQYSMTDAEKADESYKIAEEMIKRREK